MKVVLITFLFDPGLGGGAANSARRLARGLRDKGVDVIVITTHGEKEDKVSQRDGLKIYQISPHNLYWVAEKDQQPTYKKIPWQIIDTWNPDAYRRVQKILDVEQPDVVHVHKLRGLSPSVWQAAKKSGCQRIVQTCRDYELMSPEGTLSGSLGEYADRGAWFVQPYQWLRSRFSRQVQVATAPSAYTLRMLTSRGFFSDAEHIVVPNTHGFDSSELDAMRKDLKKSNPGSSDDHLRFLYLGRLEDVKGVDILCASFIQCAEHFPHIRLDIVGYGTQEEALRREFGEHPQIMFHGPLFGESNHSLLAACDVMIVPSVWPEVFGNVVVEAYAFGKPVIAASSGGLSELIIDGQTGYLVGPGDSKELVDKLNKFALDPVLAKEMSDACFDAAKLYATDVITERYLDAYYGEH